MTNDITILSCPICNNPKLREYGNGIYRCDVCETYFDKDENVVLTEQEWLQTCTAEQLADVFFEYRYVNATPRQKLWMSASEECIKKDVVKWLKQPHTKGDSE